MATEKVSLLQHDRLAGLLAELEAEHGPVAAQVIAEVREAWPAREENKALRRTA